MMIIYCLYHNHKLAGMNLRYKRYLTFVKMDRSNFVLDAPKHVNMYNIPNFKSIGKDCAEYELYYNLYSAQSLLSDYVGFIQYDMKFNPKVLTIKMSPNDIIVFQAYKFNAIWEQPMTFYDKNSLDVLVGDFNQIYSKNISIADIKSSTLPMCGSIVIHKDKFNLVMKGMVEFINTKLNAHKNAMKCGWTKKRYEGQILERFMAITLVGLKLKQIPFKISHACGSGV